MDEQVKNVLNITDKLESRINSYWNFYTIVVLAVIGWLMSSKAPFSTSQGIALTIALLMFFAANFFLMRLATLRLLAFECELSALSSNLEFASDELKRNLLRNSMPYRLPASYILHFVVDAAVIYAIWSKLA